MSFDVTPNTPEAARAEEARITAVTTAQALYREARSSVAGDWSIDSFGPHVQMPTKDLAVFAWALIHHPRSFYNYDRWGSHRGRDGTEWMSWIYRHPETGFYMFGNATRGGSEVRVPNPTLNRRHGVALIHTHPVGRDSYGTPRGETFSTGDGNVAYTRGVPLYVVTPSGAIRRIDASFPDGVRGGRGIVSNYSPYVTTLPFSIPDIRRRILR